ncbi:MFS transporter [Sphingobium lignivorans]|uniref:DHA2 family multidrug resistance protein-like MFS transporter n=1 Tax=Sphingobium lignivorans TaxID=2735886 RepID=A0ABR6NFG4_9SPHN|nr:MFS transporter [Sphingobium lignivorans]MBB5986023.1 DHA2 family multidrug resistance protein-like MFS transporter [Sphingobium lignivorans]
MDRSGNGQAMAASSTPAHTPSFSDGLPTPRRYWALAGLWAGMAMSVIDGSFVNIALPSIARDLSISPASATWVITTYQIAMVMGILPFSALGERLGYGRVYLVGMSLFVLMSLVCSLAPDLETLATCRFLQGIGAAAMMAINGAQIRHTWPRSLLGRGIGYNAVVVSSVAASGPAVAGFILSFASWHWLFLVNVPIGLAALTLVMRFGPRTPPTATTFDWQGALLSALMFAAFFLAASDAAHGHWSVGMSLAVAFGFVMGFWLFRRAQSGSRPILPLDLLRIGRMRLAYAASICGFGSLMVMMVVLPFFLEGTRRIEPAMVGLVLLPLPIALAVSAPLAGRFSDRSWAGLMSAAGLTLLALALALMAWMLPHHPPLKLLALLTGLCGIGFGLFQSPNNNVMLRTAPIERAGAAAGMQAICRLLGQTMGALVAALCLGSTEQGPLLALGVAAVLALLAAASASRR